ncbi:hypothetical protein YC2023_109217 [Brassica napus]
MATLCSVEGTYLPQSPPKIYIENQTSPKKILYVLRSRLIPRRTDYPLLWWIYMTEKSAKIDTQFIAPKTVLFRIEDQHMKARVLQRHFWRIADIPLVVQEWTPDAEASKPDLMGTTKLHPDTVRYTQLDVARILVVLNLEEPLPEPISIRVKNGKQKKDKYVVTEKGQPEVTVVEHCAMKGVE